MDNGSLRSRYLAMPEKTTLSHSKNTDYLGTTGGETQQHYKIVWMLNFSADLVEVMKVRTQPTNKARCLALSVKKVLFKACSIILHAVRLTANP